MILKKFSCVLLFAATAALAAAPVRAATFDTITSSTVITDGNATYSNFTYGGVTLPATVTLTTSTSGPTSTITFARTAADWSLSDHGSVITYHVDFATPISSLGLAFTGSATGGATAFVSESVTDPIAHIDYAPIVVMTGFGPTNSTATLNFATPVSSLDIVKSIDTAGVPGDGVSASITSVNNTYTIPEPASLTLLSLAALPLLRRRRR